MKTRLTRNAFCAALVAMVTGALTRAQTPATAVAQIVTIVKPKVDVFLNQSQTYTLACAPASGTTPMVYVNGLLMCMGTDYDALAGKVLTFTAQQIGASPCVQVLYWTAE